MKENCPYCGSYTGAAEVCSACGASFKSEYVGPRPVDAASSITGFRGTQRTLFAVGVAMLALTVVALAVRQPQAPSADLVASNDNLASMVGAMPTSLDLDTYNAPGPTQFAPGNPMVSYGSAAQSLSATPYADEGPADLAKAADTTNSSDQAQQDPSDSTDSTDMSDDQGYVYPSYSPRQNSGQSLYQFDPITGQLTGNIAFGQRVDFPGGQVYMPIVTDGNTIDFDPNQVVQVQINGRGGSNTDVQDVQDVGN